MKVLLTRRLPAVVVATLEGVAEVVRLDGDASHEALVAAVRDADALIPMVTDRVDRSVIEAGASLRLIANVGVGYNNIDVAAARERGVIVTNTPDVLSRATADLTWALILGITRRIGEGERMVRRGEWPGWAFDQLLGMELNGKTLGIIGFGRIGREVAARAPAFGVRVVHTGRDADAIPMDRLLSTSDIVSLHVPLSEATRHLIDQPALARMKRSAYLINTARGPVVDEAALAWALKSRLLAGAALDVYEQEPKIHPDLFAFENVILAPHLGSATTETRTAMADSACTQRRRGAVRVSAAHAGAMSRRANVAPVMRALAGAITGLELPAVEKISESQAEDPFQILIATLLSARTQDATTHAASTRLFKVARTPRTMARLAVREIERLIYPVSFFRNKAEHVKACCEMLVSRFGGRVPATMEELVSLPGVGRKTANLVLILAFKSQQNICVDIHVHRISNRLGWVKTTMPEETEQALYKAADRRWWPLINLYLVTWGQNVCRPVHPRCGDCVIAAKCPRIGVTRRD